MKKIFTLVALFCLLKAEAQTSVNIVNCGGNSLYVRVTFSDSTASELVPSAIECPDKLQHYDTAETVFLKCLMELFSDPGCTQPVGVDPRFFAFDGAIISSGTKSNPSIVYGGDCTDTLPLRSTYANNYRIDYTPIYIRRCVYECVPNPMHQCFSNNPATLHYTIVIDCCYAPTVLAVRLVSFQGVRNGGINSLSWALDNTADLSRIELERSFDGATYTLIYRTNDATITGYIDGVDRTAYYRLRVYNTNNTTFRSAVVVLKSSSFSRSLSVWPSPFRDELHVSVSAVAGSRSVFRLVSMDGKTVFSAERKLTAGLNELVFKLPAICPGDYVLTVSGPEGTQARKVLKH